MLPDIPEIKQEIASWLLTYIRRRIEQQNPLLADIKHFVQHEGTLHENHPVGGPAKTECIWERPNRENPCCKIWSLQERCSRVFESVSNPVF